MSQALSHLLSRRVAMVALGAIFACKPAVKTDSGVLPDVPSPAVLRALEPAGDDDPADAGAALIDSPTARRVVITAAGDIVLHKHVVQVAQSFRETGGMSWMLSRLAPIITPREIAVVNLEGPLTTSRRAPWVGNNPALGGYGAYARNLSNVGFDAVILANNHAMDQRQDGLEETLEVLDTAGMGAIGAGRSEDDAYTAWTAEREGVRVAFFGFTEHSAYGFGTADGRAFVSHELQRVLTAISTARQNADVIVVCPHWGRDRVTVPNANQRALARRFIDAGADLVLGTGPSVLQTVERVGSERGDAVVAYSLGTLVSNFGSAWHQGVTERGADDPMAVMYDPKTRDGALLRVQFEIPSPGQVALVSMSAVATWTVNFQSDVHVVPLRHAEDRIRVQRMPVVSQALGQAVRVRP
jgi:poly-gamma-glutamate synthesis protein (capsule biosynthesis protein)